MARKNDLESYDSHYESEKGKARRYNARIIVNFIRQLLRFGYKYEPQEVKSRWPGLE